jgi:hypothetical protein
MKFDSYKNMFSDESNLILILIIIILTEVILFFCQKLFYVKEMEMFSSRKFYYEASLQSQCKAIVTDCGPILMSHW